MNCRLRGGGGVRLAGRSISSSRNLPRRWRGLRWVARPAAACNVRWRRAWGSTERNGPRAFGWIISVARNCRGSSQFLARSEFRQPWRPRLSVARELARQHSIDHRRAAAGLSSSFAAVPLQTSGNVAAIADFQGTDGVYRLDSLRRFASILPTTDRRSLLATVQGKSARFAPFAELSDRVARLRLPVRAADRRGRPGPGDQSLQSFRSGGVRVASLFGGRVAAGRHGFAVVAPRQWSAWAGEALAVVRQHFSQRRVRHALGESRIGSARRSCRVGLGRSGDGPQYVSGRCRRQSPS